MIITKSKLNINKGAYPEEIINRTGLYYLEKNIGILEKRQIPICILNKTNDKITGKLLSKSSVDYFCFLNNRYSEFEVKQTSNDYFSITQLLAHQMNYLKKMKNIKINTFLIIYFSKYDTFYIANFE
jgi:recombination protein U